MKAQTIEAHVGGAPVRLIVDGFPAVPGRSMPEKQAWAERNADHLRRMIVREPRGHKDVLAIVLTEPVHPGSHVGVLFMSNGRFEPFAGHAVVAALTIAIDRGLFASRVSPPSIVCDTPAGPIRFHLGARHGETGYSATLTGVPSFVVMPGVEVTLRSRRLRADVAFSGTFLAIVDSEAAGLAIDIPHLPELRRIGVEIANAINQSHAGLQHPVFRKIAGIGGTVFTGPASGAADLRCATVFAEAAVDRSPVSGAPAVITVLNAMGLLPDDQPVRVEGLLGAEATARIAVRTTVGEIDAVVPELSTSAWIVGESSIVADADDPLAEGIDL